MKVEVSSIITSVNIFYSVDYQDISNIDEYATITFKTMMLFKIGSDEMIKEISNTVKVNNEDIMKHIRHQNNLSEIYDGIKTGNVGRYFNFTVNSK